MHRIIAALILSLFVFTVSVRSDDPVSSSVTFNREVIRIFERKCLQCHAPGRIAMSLATYRDARAWSRAIREELIEQRMPPWGAAPGYSPVADDASLTSREMAMLLTWLDGGVPRGEERDLPRHTAASQPIAAPPDVLLPLPAQRVPADQEYVVRRVTVSTGGARARRVRRIELRPGAGQLLRAAFIYIVTPTGRAWLGAWTPWQHATTFPAGTAFNIPAGAQLQVELHYRGAESAMEDRSSLALYDAIGASTAAGPLTIATRPSKPGALSVRRGVFRLPIETRVWGMLPRLTGARTGAGGSVEITARRPDGSAEILLWIPAYRYDWPTPYFLSTPVALPAGTSITVTATGVPLASVALSTFAGSGVNAARVSRRQP